MGNESCSWKCELEFQLEERERERDRRTDNQKVKFRLNLTDINWKGKRDKERRWKCWYGGRRIKKWRGRSPFFCLNRNKFQKPQEGEKGKKFFAGNESIVWLTVWSTHHVARNMIWWCFSFNKMITFCFPLSLFTTDPWHIRTHSKLFFCIKQETSLE